MKSVTSVLDVETDCVDNAIGAGNGGRHGAFVMSVGGNLFDAIVLGPSIVPRDHAHPGAGRAQIAHHATANKAGPAKHSYAAHSQIRRIILCDAVDRPVKCGTYCFNDLCWRAASIDMMRNHVDQNLCRGSDRMPLLLSLIDQRFRISVQALRLFDDRSCPMEKIDQRLGRWQGFLDLPELCVVKAGGVPDELNEPVLQHCLTPLVRSRSLLARDDFSSNRHPSLAFCLSRSFRKTGVHFSGSCSRLGLINGRLLPHPTLARWRRGSR